jgi:hypothetical protein
MATTDVSAVSALNNKGAELYSKGHYARSADYYARAVVAAQALGAQDCLIVANLQIEQAKALSHHSQTRGLPRAEVIAARRELACVLPAAVATLQRRKAAGTLLGAYPPVEQAWYAASVRYTMSLCGKAMPVAADDPLTLALVGTFGHEMTITASYIALHTIVLTPPAELAATREQLQTMATFIASAVDLMLQPSHAALGGMPMMADVTFVDLLSELTKHGLLAPGPLLQPVWDAWARFRRSGALEARGFSGGMLAMQTMTATIEKNAATTAAACGLRPCALTTCDAREAHASHFKFCGSCRQVCYCCKAHQTEDWPAHKKACKAARKAEQAGPSNDA